MWNGLAFDRRRARRVTDAWIKRVPARSTAQFVHGRAGFDARLTDQIQNELWLKFVRLTALSGMMAVTRSPLGVIRDDADLWAMLQAALMEGMAVAHAKRIQLPPHAFSEILGHVGGMPPHAKSSMLQDLEHGRRLELPWLNATLARLGDELGVPTPIHRFIATALRPFVNGLSRT